jgi:hypothetical protein
MKKEYFKVNEYHPRIDSMRVENSDILEDEKGLYVEHYFYGSELDDEIVCKTRLFDTEEEAKKYLISQTERKVEGMEQHIEEWKSILKELKVQ